MANLEGFHKNKLNLGWYTLLVHSLTLKKVRGGDRLLKMALSVPGNV